jgi:hypothetical protein
MRNYQGASLVVRELSLIPVTAEKSTQFAIAPACTKGNLGRDILIPLRVVRLMLDYVELERDVAYARALTTGDDGLYAAVRNPLLLTWSAGASKYRRPGDRHTISVARLTPGMRNRAVECEAAGAELHPCQVWLTEHGAPMKKESWNKVFKAATIRCRSLSPEWRTLNVTPHTLRHTFAVNMLAELTRAFYGAFQPGALRNDLARAAGEIIGNPLLQLKKLMGHRSVETTMIYLAYMEEAKDIVETASLEWAARTRGSR